MKTQRIATNGYRLRLGVVNAYLITSPQGVALIDCGMPGNASKIERALDGLGFRWRDLRYILITHGHPDHAGSLAEIQKLAPDAVTAMHACEAALVRQGIAVDPRYPLKPAPGLHNLLLFHGFVSRVPGVIEPARVDLELHEGHRLPIAGGVDVYATPGHTRGHLGFLWHADRGVFFAGDAASSLFGPSYAVAYENLEVARATLRRIAELPFQCLCFGHGAPISRDAKRVWQDAFVRGDELWVPTPEPLCSRTSVGQYLNTKTLYDGAGVGEKLHDAANSSVGGSHQVRAGAAR